MYATMQLPNPRSGSKGPDETIERRADGGADMMRQGLRELYARHHGFVWRVCWRYVQNSADADDLAHDVLVKAARGWSRFTGECAVTSWLYRIAVNHCCDHLRRRRVHDAAREHSAFDLLDACAGADARSSGCGPGVTPFPHDAPDAIAAKILATLRTLCEGPERHIVYLRFEVGLPQHGIARVLGLPRAAVRRRLDRIVERASLLWRSHEYENPASSLRRGSWGQIRS